MQEIISINKGICKMPKWRMAEPVDFSLAEGEQIAIVGANGAGKSMLADMIVGRHPLFPDTVRYDFSPSTKEFLQFSFGFSL